MNQLTELQNRLKCLVAESDDAENRMRRNNVWVLGLPEGSKRNRLTEFVEAFFKDILGLEDICPTYVAVRAHRVPMGRPISGAHVVPVIKACEPLYVFTHFFNEPIKQQGRLELPT